MEIIKYANLALRFLLELCALVALGYWGFQVGKGNLAKAGFAIAVPLLTAIVWGMFVAPNATVPVSGITRTGHFRISRSRFIRCQTNYFSRDIWDISIGQPNTYVRLETVIVEQS